MELKVSMPNSKEEENDQLVLGAMTILSALMAKALRVAISRFASNAANRSKVTDVASSTEQ